MKHKAKASGGIIQPGQVVVILDGKNPPLLVLGQEPDVNNLKPLNDKERSALQACMTMLLKNGDAFKQVAEALYKVQTQQLHRASHSTFSRFVMTYLAYRPVTMGQFWEGNVPKTLAECRPPKAVPAAPNRQQITTRP